MKPFREIQQLGGYRSTVRRDLRQLDIGFYGIGCPHPAIECAIAQIGKLLMHTGCKSDLGIKLQTSLEAFIIELGISDQPFTEDYLLCGKWATHSWVKTIWEKAQRFRLTIELNCVQLKPPRGEHDFWLMKELRNICTVDELVRLNRVRLHQQVLFGSNIMDAGGRVLDKKYLKERPWGENWSSLKFPNERPPPKTSNCGVNDSHNFGIIVGYKWAITLMPDIRCGIGLMILKRGSFTIGYGMELRTYTRPRQARD
jgi:hypothetical protein